MKLLSLVFSFVLAANLNNPYVQKRDVVVMTLEDEIRRATAILERHTTVTENSRSE